MHLESYNTTQLLELLDKTKTVGIFPSKIAGVDAFSAAVGLYYILQETGKEVSLVYQGKFPDGCDSLIKREEVKTNVKDRTLSVSIDYADSPAGKVHYTTEDDTLTLHLSPVQKDFDLSKVKASITGYDYDLVFTVGVSELSDLGQVYDELKEDFDKSKIVNIDNTDRNTKYGYLNFVDAMAHSLSNLVFNLAYKCEFIPNEKAAKALLNGMSYYQPKY